MTVLRKEITCDHAVLLSRAPSAKELDSAHEDARGELYTISTGSTRVPAFTSSHGRNLSMKQMLNLVDADIDNELQQGTCKKQNDAKTPESMASPLSQLRSRRRSNERSHASDSDHRRTDGDDSDEEDMDDDESIAARGLRQKRPDFSPDLSIQCDTDDGERAALPIRSDESITKKAQLAYREVEKSRKLFLRSLSSLHDPAAASTEADDQPDRRFRNREARRQRTVRPASAPIPRESWFFRSSIPGQIVFGTSQPGISLQSNISETTNSAAPSEAATIRRDLPFGIKHSLWKASVQRKSKDRLPNATRVLKAVLQDENLCQQVFLQHATARASSTDNSSPEVDSDESMMTFTDFLGSLEDVKVVAEAHLIDRFGLEFVGIKEDLLQELFISTDDAREIFALEASSGPQAEGHPPEARPDEWEALLHSSKDVTAAGMVLTLSGFRGALHRMLGVLGTRRSAVRRRLPGRPVTAKNRRLPLEALLELRGRSTATGASPLEQLMSLRGRSTGSPPLRNSPPVRNSPSPSQAGVASLSPGPARSPSRSLAGPREAGLGVGYWAGLRGAERQRAILRAIRGGGFGLAGHQLLALQIARQCVVEVERALEKGSRTRAELEKVLFLRDNAMASVGLHDPEADGGGFVELGDGVEVLEGRERQLTPAWAWSFPASSDKPPAPVPTGWYLISDDPGPVLRISGPFPQRAQCIASIIEPRGKAEVRRLGVQRFQAASLEDGKLVERVIINSFGQRLDQARDKVPDGWYVMIPKAEQARWKASIDMVSD